MKFIDYLARQGITGNLNEAVKFKPGDLGTFIDKNGEKTGLMVVGALSSGYVATSGGMIGVYSPKSIKKFGIDELETCVYIDESGKVEGKYPVSVYSGDFDSFLSILDGEDEDY